MFPEAVDDYVGSDNPVRFIDVFVGELDLTAAGFLRVEAMATGRPGYAPDDLLKLYIYGFIYRTAQKAAALWRYLTRRHKRRRPRRARASRDTIKDRKSRVTLAA